MGFRKTLGDKEIVYGWMWLRKGEKCLLLLSNAFNSVRSWFFGSEPSVYDHLAWHILVYRRMKNSRLLH